MNKCQTFLNHFFSIRLSRCSLARQPSTILDPKKVMRVWNDSVLLYAGMRKLSCKEGSHITCSCCHYCSLAEKRHTNTETCWRNYELEKKKGDKKTSLSSLYHTCGANFSHFSFLSVVLRLFCTQQGTAWWKNTVPSTAGSISQLKTSSKTHSLKIQFL